MSETTIINKIKTVLGMETETEKYELATMKLADGITIIEAEEFAEGKEVVIVTEDGKVAVPVGEYEMEDGKMLVIKEEGIIAEIKEQEEAEEEKEEEPTENPEAKHTPQHDEEYMQEEAKTPKKIIEAITKESHFSEMETLKKENAELTTLYNEVKAELDSLKKETTKETEEVELSMADEPKPIVHNPENKTSKVDGFKYSQNRMETTLDRVMNRLSK